MVSTPRALRCARQLGWGTRAQGKGVTRVVTWALTGAFLCALVLSPLLSRMHQVLHFGHGVADGAVQARSAQALAPSAERSDFERLFGAHAQGSQLCQLSDHSPSSDGATPQAQVPLLVLPTLSVPTHSNPSCTTGSFTFFQARGPPALL